MTKYEPEDIERVEEVVKITIDILNSDDERNQILYTINQLLTKEPTTENLVSSLENLFSEKINQILNSNNRNRNIFQLINKRSKLKGGIQTFIRSYLVLFLISKGLEFKYGYKVTSNLFELLPYSSFNNITQNNSILGILNSPSRNPKLTLSIPLLTNSMLVFGRSEEDKLKKVSASCPYTRVQDGKDLNKTLALSMLYFLQNLFELCFTNITQNYLDKSINNTPMFVNYLLGRFEINELHLKRYSQFFEKLS